MILEKDTAIPLKGNPITLNIDDEKIGGSGCCNSYGGDFLPAEETIEFYDIISTKMWCANAPTENKYFQTLKKPLLFKLRGNELVLMDANKRSILKFTESSK